MHKVSSDKRFCVYKHTSPSGKCYIGITCKPVEVRWRNGRGYYGKTKKSGKYNHPYFVNAIDKYGWDNFTHEILYFNLEEKQAKILEIGLIKYYKKQNLSYNITDGGEGVLGVKHKAWNKGIKMPEDKKRYGFKMSDEAVEKIRLSKIGKVVWPPPRAVNLYTADGQYLDTFERSSDLARYLNAAPSNVNQVCLHNYNTVHGMQVRYHDDTYPLRNIDYYTKLESKEVVLFDNTTGFEYEFKTIYAASRFTGIKDKYLIRVATGQVPCTHNVICKYK